MKSLCNLLLAIANMLLSLPILQIGLIQGQPLFIIVGAVVLIIGITLSIMAIATGVMEEK